jgi:hypothetical protein
MVGSHVVYEVGRNRGPWDGEWRAKSEVGRERGSLEVVSTPSPPDMWRLRGGGERTRERWEEQCKQSASMFY